MKRIGMLTSGGDCQALNATMRGIVKGVCNALDEVELYGFEEGYKGLIYGNYRMLTPRGFFGNPDQGRNHSGKLPPALQNDAGAG